MSPSEFDLRAALRSGEGDGLDPDGVIRKAQVARAAHRQRLVRAGSIAAVVVVVGGLGIGGAVALHGSSAEQSSGSAGYGSAQSAASQPSGVAAPAATQPAGPAAGTAGGGSASAAAAGTATGSTAAGNAAAGGSAAGSATSGLGGGNNSVPAAPGPAQDAARIACPAVLPNLAEGKAAGGSLFSGAVEAVKVCAYAKPGGRPVPAADGGTVHEVYTGQRATDIAASIDAADSKQEIRPCPQSIPATATTLVIIGVSRTGAAMAPIIADVNQSPCNLPITNGTTTHFDWTPPASMSNFVAAAKTGLGSISPGKATGTPAR